MTVPTTQQRRQLNQRLDALLFVLNADTCQLTNLAQTAGIRAKGTRQTMMYNVYWYLVNNEENIDAPTRHGK